MDFSGVNLSFKITHLNRVILDAGSVTETDWACLIADTELRFSKTPNSPIKLTGSVKTASTQHAIVKPDFRFEDMGIGGLDDEFSTIFRRAFASRIFPSALIEKLGVQHVRGVLLQGPPGTGKTLIARQIGKMLNAHEPKIVNGPEVLNKYVGQSEENIRNLFKDAEAEYKARGDESKLHIIIFDELDAICKQRSGRSDGGTGVGDSIVNQLLSKMDGVEQLNNILIIGMTNRLDLIDEALLRPGRLEVQLEIGLPTESGRLQILKIHTASMRAHHGLAEDVDLDELAARSKNFTGAEITGLIKSAVSFALNRHIKVGTMATIDTDTVESLQIGREDFLRAFDEVQAAFGVDVENLEGCAPYGVIDFAAHLDWILGECRLSVANVRENANGVVSVLLYGPSGSGKTAIAAQVARQSEFPFIDIIAPGRFVGMSDASRIGEINRAFSSAYKSKTGLIIIDSIEDLIDYVPVGPRFSSALLQTLKVQLKRQPPKGRGLLIIATTSRRQILEELDLTDCFSKEVLVPCIDNLDSVLAVARDIGKLSETDVSAIALALTPRIAQGSLISVPVKKLIDLVVDSAQDAENSAETFVSRFLGKYVRS
jgi:vesicle-fusing ATPase